jgi:uncharacterized protein YrrD
MHLKKGAMVFSSDNEEIGSIDRVVLNPVTREVTHIIISKGFLFTQDKVVPVKCIESTTDERVVLKEKASTITEEMPQFEETHYVPIHSDKYYIEKRGKWPKMFYYYPPVGITWDFYGYPLSPYYLKTDKNIPQNTVALEEGAKIKSVDGKYVGNVDQVLTEAKTDKITHLVISSGLLFKERKLVPISWVSDVEEDKVTLAVESDFLEKLDEYSQ